MPPAKGSHLLIHTQNGAVQAVADVIAAHPEFSGKTVLRVGAGYQVDVVLGEVSADEAERLAEIASGLENVVRVNHHPRLGA